MKKLITCLAAGLLVISAQSLLAQNDSTTTPSDSTTTAPATHKTTSAQRKERMEHLMKVLGLTKADLKGLSKEDRQAKMKEAAEKVQSELKSKKDAGTITEQEKKDLATVDRFLAHGHKKAASNQ